MLERKHRDFLPFLVLASLAFAVPASAAVLQVGPTRTYTTPCKAIAAASDGDTIQIDPVVYMNDTCNIYQSNLTIEGVLGPNGERPEINDSGLTDTATTGHLAGYKGIFVPKGTNTTVKNIIFSHAMISNDNGANGAGIRVDGTDLTVLNCLFEYDQDGILESNVAGSHIVIKYSEFSHNGVADPAIDEGFGQTHNLYIGHCASLVFAFNYSHDANEGHLLKTRAAVNYVLYNRLSGENGTDSYEVDIPNGGTSYVIGNVIVQGPNSDNSTLLAYREEGGNSRNPGSDVYVINNTFVNQKSTGTFTEFGTSSRPDDTPAFLQNNVFDGPGTLTNQSNAVLETNFVGDPSFVDAANYNFQLNPGSPAIDTGSQPRSVNDFSLAPKYQYVHPACGQYRHPISIIDIGAYEYGGGGVALDCR